MKTGITFVSVLMLVFWCSGCSGKVGTQMCSSMENTEVFESSADEPVVEEETKEQFASECENEDETGHDKVGEITWNARTLMEEVNVGWNLGNSLGTAAKECGYDANPEMETRWGNPKVSRELIDFVHSLGFNTIRIPVSWCYNCGRDENGKLVIGEQWLDRVHEVVDYAIENDMYVILNTMCDAWVLFRCGVEDEAEWEQIQKDAEDLWLQIARSFADYDERLMFESYNELDNAVTGFTYSELAAEQMNVLNQIFVTTVRSTKGGNSKRILLVPTLFDGTLTHITDAFRLPQDTVDDGENYLVVSVHCYESEFDQDIEWKFQELEEFANRVGAPVFITEFGANGNYPLLEYREEFTSNYIARAGKHGIKCCIWDDGGRWKLVERNDFSQTNMDMIHAVFEGVEGKTCETDAEAKAAFDDMDDFFFGSLSLTTGLMEMVDYQNKYWATLTTKTGDDGFPEVKDGDYLCVSMVTKGEACDFWIYYVCFLDEEKNIIEYKVGKDIIHRFLCTEIPDNARYYVVNTYDPYHNHKPEDVRRYFENGELAVRISYVNVDEK